VMLETDQQILILCNLCRVRSPSYRKGQAQFRKSILYDKMKCFVIIWKTYAFKKIDSTFTLTHKIESQFIYLSLYACVIAFS